MTPEKRVMTSESYQTSSKDLSPGLFLTPSPAKGSQQAVSVEGSDAEEINAREKNSKFLALVAKKAEQRKAKEAEEKARKREQEKDAQSVEDDNEDLGLSEQSDDVDANVAERLTQQETPPARKASKKAIEQMNRETQRISRNMQLAHQAKTKKKITKESLLARFQFGAPALPTPDPTEPHVHSTTASSAPASDCEKAVGHETPPTSPVHPPEAKIVQQKEMVVNEQEALKDQVVTDLGHLQDSNSFEMNIDDPVELADDEDELPELMEAVKQSLIHKSKGKGKAVDQRSRSPEAVVPQKKKYVFKHPPVRIHPKHRDSEVHNAIIDSDDDLEIMTAKPSRKSIFDAFERVPKAENVDRKSLRTLRALAHLHSPPSKQARAQKYMSTLDMQTSLHKRARQQALEERQAKIEELKAKGIFVQTAEEREKEQVEVEDLLEKARRENEEIREKEKRAAKKARAANGEAVDPADLSSEGDEDYAEGGSEDSDPELSGSEDEHDEGGEEDEEREDQAEIVFDDDGDEDEDLEPATNGLIDGEASDDRREEAEIEADVADDEADDEEVEAKGPKPHRRRAALAILDDDEEDSLNSPEAPLPSLPDQPHSAAAKIPAIFQHKNDGVPFGLTQAFAATMADTQPNSQSLDDSPLIFESPPEPVLPPMPTLPAEDSLQMIASTQDRFIGADLLNETETQDHELPLPQDSMEGIEGLPGATQFSELPDPTQDEGFGFSSPAPENRFVSEPPSTVATVIVPDQVTESPVIQKKRGRLQRRTVPTSNSDSEDDLLPQVATNLAEKGSARPSHSPDAFTKMKKKRAAALAREEFNKKKSEAKEMVEEQAQESEDEYAGLGGASDEDSNEEDEEFVREMIDQNEVDVDERKLAALYA